MWYDLKMENIKEIKITDRNYPELLKKITDAPEVLYYKGILPQKNENCFGVVGTRRASSYGQQATLDIAGELADAGLTIVSGMAPGIDTFAHTICVEKNKRTIAVLGTGLDEKSMYPQQNLELSRKILATGGCLISELPARTHGSKITFPNRNRIISALSLGILVVEAKEKSGSLITAQYAKNQKKKLFAVPGPIYTLNASGPNKLIKEGATLVELAQDILDVLALSGVKGLEIEPQKFAWQIFAAENTEENLILQALKEESLYIDTIIEKTKLQASVAASTLALMEISGKIRHLGGNIYAIA